VLVISCAAQLQLRKPVPRSSSDMSLGRFSVVRSIAAFWRSAGVASASLARGYCTASHTGVSRRTLQETASDWRYWTASSAATLALIVWLQAREGPAHCLTEPTQVEDHVTEESSCMLRQWLDSVGADVDAIDVRESVEVSFFLTGCKELKLCGLTPLPFFCSIQMQA